jgi:mannose-6-phosphate isomerase-like protein (cupin superfamily)
MHGSGSMEINERTFDVNSGDVVLIEDGEFHRVHNNGTEILEFVCVFDGKRLH